MSALYNKIDQMTTLYTPFFGWEEFNGASYQRGGPPRFLMDRLYLLPPYLAALVVSANAMLSGR